MTGAILGLAIVALTVTGGFGGATQLREVRLVIRVSGPGGAVAGAGEPCHHRCTRSFGKGTRLTLIVRPRMGYRFLQWSGACGGRGPCRITLDARQTVTARFGPLPDTVSWNPAYSCHPVLTTIPFIVGSQSDSLGGATESGGGFQPHLRGDAQKHLLHPPCSISGKGIFVTVRDVVLSNAPERSGDGDDTVNLEDPDRPDIASAYMKTLEAEIDNLLIVHHVAPAMFPPQGAHVDVQGFVFWDPDHTNTQSHSYSGWEIHPLTAWRPAARSG
jgi:hypothetical protein